MSNIAEVIKNLRDSKEWSQRKLSLASGVSNTEISRIENGKRPNPSLKTLDKLAKSFNISLEELLSLSGLANINNEVSTTAEEKKPKDLQKILEDHEIMFDGIPLDDDEKQEILDIIQYKLYKRAKELNKRKK